MLENNIVQPKGIFYGWFVVAACFAVTFTLGEAMWSFGVLFKPLEDDFGWSRGAVSSGYTAFIIGFAVSSVISGWLADRFDPRLILGASAPLVGIGISLCSQMNSLTQFQALMFLAGLGGGATWPVPSATVQRWFYLKPQAGLALAITSCGVGVGALVIAPLTNLLISAFSWRTTYLITGIAFFIIVAVSCLAIKPAPAGLKTHQPSTSTIKPSQSFTGWSTSKALLSRPYLVIMFTYCVAVLTWHAISVHLVPRATDAGIVISIAAVALGLVGGISVPGRLLSGLVSGKIGWRWVLVLSFSGMALSILWLVFLDAAWMLFFFVVCYGLCHGLRIPAHVGIVGSLFGMRSIGELTGITLGIAQLVGAFAPYFTGAIFDVAGSYAVAFSVIMVLLLSGAAAFAMMKPPAAEKG